MNINKIKKLLDDIEKSSLEGWDYNQRANFQDVMLIVDKIKEELNDKQNI